MSKKEITKIFVGTKRTPFEMPEGFAGELNPIAGVGFMVTIRKYDERFLTLVPERRLQMHTTIFNTDGDEISHVETDTDWQAIPISESNVSAPQVKTPKSRIV